MGLDAHGRLSVLLRVLDMYVSIPPFCIACNVPCALNHVCSVFNAAALFFLTLFTELVIFWASLHDTLRPSAMDGVGVKQCRLSQPQRRGIQVVVLLLEWASFGVIFLLLGTLHVLFLCVS